MAASVRITSSERDISLALSDALSPQAQSKLFADFAREQLREAEIINAQALGRVPAHETFVDGVRGADEDRVRPDGVIIYEFELATELFIWIDEQLRRHSPVLTGEYRASHTFYADGEEANPAHPPMDAMEYVFLSLVPYARKIEGTGGRAPQSAQAPDGVYQVVAQMARSRFGNQAKINFSYRSATGGALARWANSESAKRHAARHGRVSKPEQWLTRQPAIVITLR